MMPHCVMVAPYVILSLSKDPEQCAIGAHVEGSN
jgi:hypothetical protein